MTTWARCLAFAAVMLCTGPARAIVFQHPADGFSFDFEPADARICVVIPAAETDPTDCTGVDVGKIRTAHPNARRAVVVRRPSSSYVLAFHVEPKTSGRQWGVRVERVARSWKPGAAVRNKFPDIVVHRHVGDGEIMITGWVLDDPASGGEPFEVIGYLIPGKTQSHTLSLGDRAPVTTAARRDLDEALRTLKVEVSIMARIGRHAVLIVLTTFGGGLLVAVMLYVALRRRSRSSDRRGKKRGVGA